MCWTQTQTQKQAARLKRIYCEDIEEWCSLGNQRRKQTTKTMYKEAAKHHTGRLNDLVVSGEKIQVFELCTVISRLVECAGREEEKTG